MQCSCIKASSVVVMARPKEATVSWSSALEEKYDRAHDRLQQQLATQLSSDITRMLQEGGESDIRVHINNMEMPVHSCILQCRCPRLWQLLQAADGIVNIPPGVTTEKELMQVLRYIYTADDIDVASSAIDQLVQALHQQQQKLHHPASSSSPFPAQDISNGLTMNTSTDLDSRSNEQVDNDIYNDNNTSQNCSKRGSSNYIVGTCSQEVCNVKFDVALDNNCSQEENSTDVFKMRALDKSQDKMYVCSEGQKSDNNNYDEEACSALGKNLLKMYQHKMQSDIVLQVKQKEFPAHRCVLCVRSSYFAAFLGGTWRDSNSHKVTLEGVSEHAVHQALLYMYGGVQSLPPDCHLMELVTMADMYGMDSLKDIATLHLKANCHFFHKPCADCIQAVVSTLPTAYTFGLEEFWEMALRWCSRYFSRVWTAKHFAALPQDLLDRCMEQTTGDITTENVIDFVVECDRLMGSLTNVRWSEPVVAMASKLMDACIDHLRHNFVAVIETNKFTSLGKRMSLGLSFLEDIFGRAVMTMPTDCACVTYASVYKLYQHCQTEDCVWHDDFKCLIESLAKKCEHFMRLYINQLIHTPDWDIHLSQRLQDKIREGAWYVCVGDARKMKVAPVTTATQRQSTLSGPGGMGSAHGRGTLSRSLPGPALHRAGRPHAPVHLSKSSDNPSTFRPVSRTQPLSNQAQHVHDFSKTPKAVPGKRTMIGSILLQPSSRERDVTGTAAAAPTYVRPTSSGVSGSQPQIRKPRSGSDSDMLAKRNRRERYAENAQRNQKGGRRTTNKVKDLRQCQSNTTPMKVMNQIPSKKTNSVCDKVITGNGPSSQGQSQRSLTQTGKQVHHQIQLPNCKISSVQNVGNKLANTCTTSATTSQRSIILLPLKAMPPHRSHPTDLPLALPSSSMQSPVKVSMQSLTSPLKSPSGSRLPVRLIGIDVINKHQLEHDRGFTVSHYTSNVATVATSLSTTSSLVTPSSEDSPSCSKSDVFFSHVTDSAIYLATGHWRKPPGMDNIVTVITPAVEFTAELLLHDLSWLFIEPS